MKTGNEVMYCGTRWTIIAELDENTVCICGELVTKLVDKADCHLIN